MKLIKSLLAILVLLLVVLSCIFKTCLWIKGNKRTKVQKESVTKTIDPKYPESRLRPSLKNQIPLRVILSFGTINTNITLLNNILNNVKSATEKATEILHAKDYTLHEYHNSLWLITEEKKLAKRWTLYINKERSEVSEIKIQKFKDKKNTEIDKTQSCSICFNPSDGSFLNFRWMDGHETFRVDTNSNDVVYSKHLYDEVSLRITFNMEGEMISSNVYDWAKRGRLIKKYGSSAESVGE